MKRHTLIWSFEHNAWWGPDCCGYVSNVINAGLYTEDEAKEIVLNANYAPGVLHEDARPVWAYLPIDLPRTVRPNTVLWAALAGEI